MISVPASRSISPAISSVYFFFCQDYLGAGERRLYHGSTWRSLPHRSRVAGVVPKQESTLPDSVLPSLRDLVPFFGHRAQRLRAGLHSIAALRLGQRCLILSASARRLL